MTNYMYWLWKTNIYSLHFPENDQHGTDGNGEAEGEDGRDQAD